MITLVLIIPLGLGVFNHFIGSRLLILPHGLLGEDFPLESRMYLEKNYQGYTYSLNIHNGFNKITYSTTEVGFRVPDVDFSKDLVLMSGDSILFGVGLNDWETVPYLLQQKPGLKENFSFFHAGIPGKSMTHHLLTLQNLIKLSKKEGSRINYLMLWISFNDFKENISKKLIQSRALKINLSLKDQLAFRFPSLAVFYKSLRDQNIGKPMRSILSSFFMQNKPYRNKHKLIPKDEPKQTRRFFLKSQVVENNLSHYQDLVEICKRNGIVIINVITAYSYDDIFYEKGFSEYLDETLRGMGQKNIIKIKDIYHSHPEIYPYIRGHDWSHFSDKAAQLIAEELATYLKKLEAS